MSGALRRFLLCWLLVLPPGAAAAELYRWVDEQGHVHFSDTPHADAERIVVQPPAAQKQQPQPPTGETDGSRRAREMKERMEREQAQFFAEMKRRERGQPLDFLRGAGMTPELKARSEGPFDCGSGVPGECANRDLHGRDFARSTLQAVSFAGSKLAGSNFSGAIAHKGVDFSGADLSASDFRSAHFNDADFRGADLHEANFEFVSCWNCDFTDANLRGARFDRTVLTHAKFRGASVEGITVAGARWDDVQLADARGLDVALLAALDRPQNLSYTVAGCNLGVAGADCSGKQLAGLAPIGVRNIETVNFSGARLAGADFSHVMVIDADFSKADLAGARLGPVRGDRNSFREATLDKAVFSGSMETFSADFSGASLLGTHFDGIRFGRGTVFAGARMQGAVFARADLGTVDLAGVNLDGADMRGARLNSLALQQARTGGCVGCPKPGAAPPVAGGIAARASGPYDAATIRTAFEQFEEQPTRPDPAFIQAQMQDRRVIGWFANNYASLERAELLSLLESLLRDTRARIAELGQQVLQRYDGDARRLGKPAACAELAIVGANRELLAARYAAATDGLDRTRINSRRQAISCLLVVLNEDIAVQRLFVESFPRESERELRQLLLRGFTPAQGEGPRAQLIDVLRNDPALGEAAAWQLVLRWGEPPEEELDWLMERFLRGERLGEGYGRLLGAYGARASRYLPQLKKAVRGNHSLPPQFSSAASNIAFASRMGESEQALGGSSEGMLAVIALDAASDGDIRVAPGLSLLDPEPPAQQDPDSWSASLQAAWDSALAWMGLLSDPLANPFYGEETADIERVATAMNDATLAGARVTAAAASEFHARAGTARFGTLALVFEDATAARTAATRLLEVLQSRRKLILRDRACIVFWWNGAADEGVYESYVEQLLGHELALETMYLHDPRVP